MFYKFIIHQLVSIQLILLVISSPIKVLEKGILPLETNSVAIQFYLDLENDDKLESCYLRIKSDKCCLYDTKEADCDSMKLIGNHDDVLKPKDRRTYLFFYISMFQLNHEGYCSFDLVRRCGLISSKGEEIRIPFDTSLSKKQTQYILRNFKHENIHKCKSIDEDPSNGCKPVNCDIKYAGNKPFFRKDKRRCIEAVKCVSNLYKKLPDLVYDPSTNTCKSLDHSLSVNDIYAISSGLGTIVAPYESVEYIVDNANLVLYKPNCSSISQNLFFLKDLMTGKLNPTKGYAIDVKESSNDAFIVIFSTIFGISSLIVIFVCFANAYVIIHKEWNSDCEHRKVNKMNGKTKLNGSREYGKDCGVNKDITNGLLKEVIVSELPLELRESVVDICERIGKEVRWKRRYRIVDDGSDINLKAVATSDTSTTSDLDDNEKARILK